MKKLKNLSRNPKIALLSERGHANFTDRNATLCNWRGNQPGKTGSLGMRAQNIFSVTNHKQVTTVNCRHGLGRTLFRGFFIELLR